MVSVCDKRELFTISYKEGFVRYVSDYGCAVIVCFWSKCDFCPEFCFVTLFYHSDPTVLSCTAYWQLNLLKIQKYICGTCTEVYSQTVFVKFQVHLITCVTFILSML